MAANPLADAQFISDLRARVEAERGGRPFLVFRDGNGRQQLFFFASDLASASVGRAPSADVLLDWDDQASRLHARFERIETGWEIVDDGLSRNGTFVNDEHLSVRRRLNDGDSVRFGTTTVTFRLPAPERAGTANPAAKATDLALSTSQRRVLVALCRPGKDGAGLASDEQIAEELFLSLGTVKAHVRVLCAKLGVEGLPQSQTRVRLLERAFSAGLISERDL